MALKAVVKDCSLLPRQLLRWGHQWAAVHTRTIFVPWTSSPLDRLNFATALDVAAGDFTK